jgi:hypothetical protein
VEPFFITTRTSDLWRAFAETLKKAKSPAATA